MMVLKDEADLSIAKGGQLRLGELEGVLAVQRDAAAAGRHSVPRMFKSVLLPEPLGPAIARFSPASNASDTRGAPAAARPG